MLTLIVGTNRPNSNTRKVARQVEQVYRELHVPLNVLDLAELPAEIFDPTSYAKKPASFVRFAEGVLGASGVIIVTPEYNGGVPGVLKYFIDMLKFPESFEQRPVCFVGLGAGMWGALRPVEQLQAIFGYRNAYLYPERVFLPKINDLLDTNENFTDSGIPDRLRAQARGFVQFVDRIKHTHLRKTDSKSTAIRDRLGVCSWSLQPQNPDQLIDWIKQIEIPRVQIALDPIRSNPQVWGNVGTLCALNGIELVSGMVTTIGEDYSTMETIRRTGGIVPDQTWKDNWRNLQTNAALARSLGLRLVTFHAGFLPHDQTDPDFKKLLERLRQVADLFAEHGLELGLETGQETAEALGEFLETLDRPNVGVNFDPANMILYDKGDPVQAVEALGPWLKQCHIKDANRTTKAGAWGEEVPAGAGQVDWSAFFKKLAEVGFSGDLSIEREAGTQRLKDIQTGGQFVEKVWQKLHPA
jgi:sugar phosphate isomerase/epimerase/NAD(P)H-dependent FMN reductase